jgi:hypothetical protein
LRQSGQAEHGASFRLTDFYYSIIMESWMGQIGMALMDDDSSCLAREECVRDLLQDAPGGCRLSELLDGDDD